MNEQIKEILSRVAVETLEQLAFIFSFPEDGPVEIDYDSVMAVSVSFTGPFTGGLVMTASPQVLLELAVNMLGVDDDEVPTLDQQYDALKEAMNIICGNLLPAIAGKQAVFDIGSPEIITGGEAIKEATEKYNGRSPTSMVRLDLDGEQCTLYLFGDIQVAGGLVEWLSRTKQNPN